MKGIVFFLIHFPTGHPFPKSFILRLEPESAALNPNREEKEMYRMFTKVESQI